MKTVFKIYIRDLKRIGTNFAALMIAGGLCFLPALYAWFNIAANMDPYENTGGIRIAVTNEDKGTYSAETGELDVGDQIVESLKDNDSLGWEFVDSDTAMEGVSSGEYYAAILIPEDFSSEITAILDGRLEQPEIEYYVNEKKNAIAPKVTDTGATAIQDQLNEGFVSVVSKVMADTFNSAMGDADSSIRELQEKLSAGIEDTRELMGEYEALARKLGDASDNGEELKNSTGILLDSVDDTAEDAGETLGNTEELVADTRDGISAFNDDADSALDAASAASDSIFIDILKGSQKVSSASGKVNSDLSDALDTAEDLTDKNADLIEDLESFDSSFPGILDSGLISELRETNTRHIEAVKSLKKGNSAAMDLAVTLYSVNDDVYSSVSSGKTELSAMRKQLRSAASTDLDSALNRLSAISGTAEGVLGSVPVITEQMRAVQDTVTASLDDTAEAVDRTGEMLEDISERLDSARISVDSLDSGESYERLISGIKLDPSDIADFMSSPIDITTETFYPVSNYGSAMTPFYTCLAIWVSGLILASIFKTSVDTDEKIPKVGKNQAYFGKLLLFLTFGSIQSLVISIGNIYMLRVQILSPGRFILAGLVISFVFINIIFAMAMTLKHIGKAVCVLLVILQIPGASGTYPIEMMPGFFRILRPVLPFTYGIKALRECVGGMYGNTYAVDLALLAVIFIPFAMFMGPVLGYLMRNLNHFFDLRLEMTGLMICEEGTGALESLRGKNVLRALVADEEMKEELRSTALRFEDRYGRLVLGGLLGTIFVPLAFLILAFTNIDLKLVFLMLWITSIVIACTYLIVLDYLHENMKSRLEMLDLSEEEMRIAARNSSGYLKKLRERVSQRREDLVKEVREHMENPEDRGGDEE